jgi:hypothetical protein
MRHAVPRYSCTEEPVPPPAPTHTDAQDILVAIGEAHESRAGCALDGCDEYVEVSRDTAHGDIERAAHYVGGLLRQIILPWGDDGTADR